MQNNTEFPKHKIVYYEKRDDRNKCLILKMDFKVMDICIIKKSHTYLIYNRDQLRFRGILKIVKMEQK